MEYSALQFKIGQRLVTGMATDSVNDELIELVKMYKVSNVILFDRNVKSNAQLARLCSDIQELVYEQTGHGAFIMIDQEGGAVTRLPDKSGTMPCAMALAASGNPQNAYFAGLTAGRELKLLGINFNLAPVMDINTNKNNPVIGVRSYGSTPDVVIEYGRQTIRGMTDAGILCSVKHFPGHGDTSVDSHLDLPCVDKSPEELAQTELAPFKAAIDGGVPSVMTTHILFPQLEKEKVPATMSRAIVTGLLKKQLGFRGMVLSDCLEMNAIKSYYGVAGGAVAAAGAGIDLILISHTPSLVKEAAQAMEKAYRSGALNSKELDESVEKILRYKSIYANPCQPGFQHANFESFRETARQLILEAITPVNLPSGKLPSPGPSPCFIGSGAYRSSMASGEADKSISFASYLAEKLKGAAIATSLNPGREEIASAVRQAKGHSCLILGTVNGHKNKGQIELANALTETGLPTVVVSLNEPYDLGLIDQRAYTLAAYEYTQNCFDALADVLSGKRRASGRLSVAL